MAALIVVNGAPATGKTTLSNRLSIDLGIPALSKDAIKEFMFDAVGSKDRDDSRRLGAFASEALLLFAGHSLANRVSVIIESPFHVQYARPALEKIVEYHRPAFLEVYCQADCEVRKSRFAVRQHSGERHAGHYDEQNIPLVGSLGDNDHYAPLELGQLEKLTTNEFDEQAYQTVLKRAMALVRSDSISDTIE